MSSMTCRKLSLIALGGVLLQLIGLAIFVYGFFPVKPALSGFRLLLSSSSFLHFIVIIHQMPLLFIFFESFVVVLMLIIHLDRI